jgi:hypothetical protein
VKDYLTASDVAALLGVKPSTVRSYAARGQMPAPNDCPCCGLGPVWSRLIVEDWREHRPGPGARTDRNA